MVESESHRKSPSLHDLSREVSRYIAQDLVLNSACAKALGEIESNVGAKENFEIEMVINDALQRGIIMADLRVKQVVLFSDPEIKKNIIDMIRSGEISNGRWLLRLASWDTRKDPLGLNALEACKRKDVEDVVTRNIGQINGIDKIRLQGAEAEAVEKGEELVIEYYETLTRMYNVK